jgi:hypothetical protein
MTSVYRSLSLGAVVAAQEKLEQIRRQSLLLAADRQACLQRPVDLRQ